MVEAKAEAQSLGSGQETTDCSFCGAGAASVVALPYEGRTEWDVLRCVGCGVMRMREFPTDEAIREFYQQQYYRSGDAARFPGPVEKVIRYFRLVRARQTHALLRGSGEVLDIGCGRGLILAELKRLGYGVAGTQLSDTAAEAIRTQHGIDVFLGELAEAGYESGRFDMVMMLHVLEHTKDPALYLREIARILKPGGYLLLEVPNAGCVTARRYGLDWLHWDIPHHLYHFDSNALNQQLVRMGFRVEKCTSFSLEYGPFGILQAWLNRFLPGSRHLLYRTLSGLLPKTSPLFLMHLVAAGFLTPLAIVVGLLRGGSASKGDIVTFLCRK